MNNETVYERHPSVYLSQAYISMVCCPAAAHTNTSIEHVRHVSSPAPLNVNGQYLLILSLRFIFALLVEGYVWLRVQIDTRLLAMVKSLKSKCSTFKVLGFFGLT